MFGVSLEGKSLGAASLETTCVIMHHVTLYDDDGDGAAVTVPQSGWHLIILPPLITFCCSVS